MSELTPTAEPLASPRWNTATKFLVALVALVIIGSLLERFQEMLGPLVFAFILAYLLNPLIEWITTRARLSWGAAVNLIYLALVIVTLGVLVALFQPGNWLGLSPGYYVLLIVVVYLVLQQVYDNVLYPRILGRSLNLHPIIILVGAIVATSYAGIVGLLLAAPLIATLRLFGRYVYRKMFDLDPWPEPLPQSPLPPRETWFWLRWFNRLRRRTTDT